MILQLTGTTEEQAEQLADQFRLGNHASVAETIANHPERAEIFERTRDLLPNPSARQVLRRVYDTELNTLAKKQ